MNFVITSQDLDTTFDEPRVQDVRLASSLGFARPRVVRELIERNAIEIQRYGGLPRRAANLSPRGGRPSQAYFLNEPQALLICMFSETPRAADVRQQLITVFMAWRRSQTMVPVKAHERRPSTSMDVALKLKTNVERLSEILEASEAVRATKALRTLRTMVEDCGQRTIEHVEAMAHMWNAMTAIVDEYEGLPKQTGLRAMNDN